MPYTGILGAFWAVFSLYWLISARSSKRDVSGESLGQQVLSSGGFFVGFYFLFARFTPASPLSQLPYAPSDISGALGCGVAALGLVVALWARQALGANWSRVVALKENHELVTTGPYRFVRHPIYSGMLLLVLGTAVAIAQVKGFVGLALLLGSALVRVFREDALMAATFPDTFPAYRQRTKRLIPWIF